MTHVIIATTIGIHREPTTPNTRTDYAVVAALSNTANSTGVHEHVVVPGWVIDNDTPLRYDKLVSIALPEGVEYGSYPIYRSSKQMLNGLHHTANYAKDGTSAAVILWTNETPMGPTDGDHEALIDRAIASGITASIPQPDGSRAEVPVQILAVSPFGLDGEERGRWIDEHTGEHSHD